MKHSPGPWELGGRCGNARLVLDRHKKLVVDVWTGKHDHPEHEEGLANLRLILHATQLLAMLPGLIAWAEGDCPRPGHCATTACRWRERGCPVLVAKALLDKIAGKEEKEGEKDSLDN